MSSTCSDVNTVSVSVIVLVKVILSPALDIDKPDPASKTISSVLESLPVSTIFSSSVLSPSDADTV